MTAKWTDRPQGSREIPILAVARFGGWSYIKAAVSEGFTIMSFGRKVWLFLVLSMLAAVAMAAPTVPTDVEMPGTQPGEVPAYDPPTTCDNCHALTPQTETEPFFGWEGSMMAHSSKDPLFWAALAIAEQDFLPNADPNLRGGAGDFCLRCHMPNGWLGGRSTPTDGSGMIAATDSFGVECEHCHLLVNPDPPVNVPGTVEEQTAPYIANDGAEAYRGSGMYVVNSEGSRLGPYSNAAAPHAWKQSDFHRQSEMCGTCHDVSNPVTGDLAHNFGAMTPLAPGTYSGTLGGAPSDKAAFNNPPYAYGIVERTYSEWAMSNFATIPVNDFNTLPAALQTPGGSLEVAYSRAWNGVTANYADGTERLFTCQTCHMSAATGKPAVRADAYGPPAARSDGQRLLGSRGHPVPGRPGNAAFRRADLRLDARRDGRRHAPGRGHVAQRRAGRGHRERR
jgi:hypothetical protein